MRLPVLIESRGECESAWVRKGYMRRIRLSGLSRGEVARIEVRGDHGTMFKIMDRNGCWPIPHCESLRIVGVFSNPVNIDLVM